MASPELTHALKAEALRLGFDRVGIAPAVSPPGYGGYLDWLKAGNAGGMEYLERHREARAHPDRLLEGVRSVVMTSVVYGQAAAAPDSASRGKIARYARGLDYHRVLWDKLDALLAWLKGRCPEVRGRAVVDTASLLERDFARLAGIGWIGKNTMLIDRRLGSFTFLGALLVDIDLAADEPFKADHCGTCTRCLEACPTDAFAGPHELDARRCISYLTIEHRGNVPADFADRLDGWVFGCDVCQDVCPWNRKAPAGRMAEFEAHSEWTNPDLIEWLGRTREEWKDALKGTALARTKRVGLLRNAALLLGTGRVAEAVPALRGRLADLDEGPVVRAAAAWALGRIGTAPAREALFQHREATDPDVREAVEAALGTAKGGVGAYPIEHQ
jgi:epoxyqueuosine reductase